MVGVRFKFCTALQVGVETMQEMASTILKQMGRSTINWEEMKEWEVDVVRNLMKEVESIPGFVARMVEQLLETGQDEMRW